MSLGMRREKDQLMAKRMKEAGITRTTGRCPICHDVVANGTTHVLITCKGPHRKGTAGTNAGCIRADGSNK